MESTYHNRFTIHNRARKLKLQTSIAVQDLVDDMESAVRRDDIAPYNLCLCSAAGNVRITTFLLDLELLSRSSLHRRLGDEFA